MKHLWKIIALCLGAVMLWRHWRWAEEAIGEYKWQRSFARSGDLLDRMAEEARREIEAGEFDDLEPDEL
jgi:hypothetical protein